MQSCKVIMMYMVSEVMHSLTSDMSPGFGFTEAPPTAS